MTLSKKSPVRVLLAEDDASLREVITQALTEDGFNVTAASNGAAALDCVRRAEPDVILLDMNMPVMDGPTFAEHYRELPIRHAPIVVFTAAGAAHQWAARIKAAAWLNKPFDVSVLCRLLSRLPRAHARSASFS